MVRSSAFLVCGSEARAGEEVRRGKAREGGLPSIAGARQKTNTLNVPPVAFQKDFFEGPDNEVFPWRLRRVFVMRVGKGEKV